MAKSKAFKAAKQRQREEDLAETEALDSTFTSLMQGGALAGMLKTKGKREPAGERQGAASEPGDAAYDRLRRELVYEPKGKVRLHCCSACHHMHYSIGWNCNHNVIYQ